MPEGEGAKGPRAQPHKGLGILLGATGLEPGGWIATK